MSERKPVTLEIWYEDDKFGCWSEGMIQDSIKQAEAAIRVASNMGYANWRILEPLCAALTRLRKAGP